VRSFGVFADIPLVAVWVMGCGSRPAAPQDAGERRDLVQAAATEDASARRASAEADASVSGQDPSDAMVEAAARDLDCAGTRGGSANVDKCGVCDDDPDNDCVRDCAGTWGGSASVDNCGICDRDPENDCVQDCAGTWGGSAQVDDCGICDSDPANDCVQDCTGTWGGSAQVDDCGVCNGGNASKDCAGVCNGGAIVDCLGVCDGVASGAECDGSIFLGACSGPGARDPLVPRPGETCYEFTMHGASGADDTSPVNVTSGEAFHEFVYDRPWNTTSVATRFGTDFDNEQMAFAWRAAASSSGAAHGTVNLNALPTFIGPGAHMIGMWFAGGCNFEAPADVGLYLPTSSKVVIHWHMWNTTGAPVADRSSVQVCTVPASTRPKTASITPLGTENFNSFYGMPPGENAFTTECRNNSGTSIRIIAMWPHMHAFGTSVRINHLSAFGGTTTIFDELFDVSSQIHYLATSEAVLEPDDRLATTCYFNNDSEANVAFGESAVGTEMCYQHVFSYPAGALDNGAPSLIGFQNTCW